MLVLTEKYSEPEYGIELSYPSNWTIGSGNKAQPFDVELAGRVFIIPSEGTVGAETRVSIAFDRPVGSDFLAEKRLGLLDLAHSLDPFSKILDTYTEVITKYLELELGKVEISEGLI